MYWNDEILANITGKDHLDRLSILVSGNGVIKLLNVLYFESRTGVATIMCSISNLKIVTALNIRNSNDCQNLKQFF